MTRIKTRHRVQSRLPLILLSAPSNGRLAITKPPLDTPKCYDKISNESTPSDAMSLITERNSLLFLSTKMPNIPTVSISMRMPRRPTLPLNNLSSGQSTDYEVWKPSQGIGSIRLTICSPCRVRSMFISQQIPRRDSDSHEANP